MEEKINEVTKGTIEDSVEEVKEKSVPLDFSSLNVSNREGGLGDIQDYLQRWNGNTSSYKYTSKNLIDMLANPSLNSRRIVEASKYLSAVSSDYMRLIYYMSNMLTLDYIAFPKQVNPLELLKIKGFDIDEYRKEILKGQYYIDGFKVKHEFSKILAKMCVEDVFFGYEITKVTDGVSNTIIQPLNSNYCKIYGVQDGIYVFAFDMTYFNRSTSKHDILRRTLDSNDGIDLALLSSFPREFKALYQKYLQTGDNWQLINPNKGVCFKFREDLNYILPPFAGVLPDVLDQQEIKDLQKSKNRLENFKLLLQKIPFKKDPKSANDFILDLKSVGTFHNNIKSILPKEIGIISSPMEIEEFSFEKKNNTLDKDGKDAKKEIFDSAGVPSVLFAGGSNPNSTAILKSIQSDESIMFRVLRQFERFFAQRLSYHFKNYAMDIIFPDLTVYNRSDQLDHYLKNGQYGIPSRLFLGATMGLSTSQLMAMNFYETTVLGFDESFVPLQSSHTQGGNASDNEGGGQEKPLSKMSDKGIETRDLDTNKAHRV